jgi:hypothetical protein
VAVKEEKPVSSEEAKERSLTRLRRSYFRRVHNEAAEENLRAAAEWQQIGNRNNLAGAVAELWTRRDAT